MFANWCSNAMTGERRGRLVDTCIDCQAIAWIGGRGWVRTSDPCRVKRGSLILRNHHSIKLLSGLSDASIDQLGKRLFTPGNAGGVIQEMPTRGIPEPMIRSCLNRFSRGSANLAPAAGLLVGKPCDEGNPVTQAQCRARTTAVDCQCQAEPISDHTIPRMSPTGRRPTSIALVTLRGKGHVDTKRNQSKQS